MSFDVDLYLRLSWKDERLSHNLSTYYNLQDEDLMNKIWKPDLMIANAKSAHFQTFSQPNRLVLIYPTGHIHYSVRVIANVACNLDLRFYPMDKQECYIRLTSYAHPTTEMTLEWYEHGDPITINEAIQLPEMKVLGISPEICHYTNYTYGQTEIEQLVGNWSCLKGKIRLQREIGYHLTQTYIPTCMIVMISWISFWIDPTAIPARISLSFTTLLTLSTMAAGVRIALPPVSYAKAIDYWVGTCMFFVFAALLEFALVNSFVRAATVFRAKMLSQTNNSECLLANPLASEDFHIGLCENKGKRFIRPSKTDVTLYEQAIRYSRIAKLIDYLSRYVFPGVFFLFNVVYWLFCST